MKNKRKSMFLLCLLIAFSLVLAACGGSGNKGNNDKNANKDNGNDSASEETYEITLAFLATSNVNDADLVAEEISKITKDKINATVKLLPISPSAWGQQMNLMMTGEEKLDLLVTGSELGYDLQASKGMLLPLDDLLAEYGEGITAVVPEDVLEGTKVGDEIFAVPSVRDWAREYGFYMRKDIAEKHGIDVDAIQSYEDLEAVFATIKENEPDMYPIANTHTPVGEILVSDKYDILGDRLGVVPMEGDDLTIINMFEEPEYLEQMKIVRDWYDKGYIMKDASTVEDTAISVIKSGKGFGAFSVLKPGFEIQESASIGHEMVAVSLTDAYQQTVRSWMLSIARNSDNPEKAMELMNLIYSDEDIMNLIAIGIEDKHYVVTEEGFATFPDGQDTSDYHQSQWQIGTNFLTHVWEGNEIDLWEQTEAFNEGATPSQALGFAFDPESVTTELASVNNVMEQYREGIEHGVLDPEKTIPEFNKKLKAAGLDKIMEEKQKQIDEWKANQ